MTRLRLSVPALPHALALALALVLGSILAAPAEAREIVHYQKNMAFGNKRERALANDILQQYPDTVTLQEVNRDNTKIFGMLAGTYPYRNACFFQGIGRVAVLSRWPSVPGTERCLEGRGVAAMQVEMPEGRVWVLSVHMETPGSGEQGEMVRALVPEIAAMRGPMIIGGDFNALTFEGTVLNIAEAARANLIGSSVSTYFLGGVVGLPIDHVMATGGRGSVDTLPMLGSDHLGLLARFTMSF